MPQAIPLAFAAAGSAVAGSSAVIGALGTIGASVLGAAVTLGGGLIGSLLTPKPAEQQSQARIGGVEAAPPYRYVYGRTRIGGYRVFNHVKGDVLYVGYLLNSRPSNSFEAVEFDSRPLTWLDDASNDLYDMAKGAEVDSEPFAGLVRMWAGMGGHAGPPDAFVSEIDDPEAFAASDAWLGVTVLWLRLDYGSNKSARERWISAPPDLRVTGNWSLLYDPREPGHDPADPTTWAWSENAALVALDIARDRRGLNRLDDLIDIDSFAAGAAVCEEPVALKAGGAEPRYRAGGVVDMSDAEAAKAVGALAAAAASMVDVSGRLTYLPGVWRAPALTLTDVVSDMEYSDLREGRDAPNTVRTAIIAESRAWQETEIAPLQDAVALSNDGGVLREQRLDLPLVPSPTQAMRLQKIALKRARLERRLSAGFPASAYATHAGDVVSLALPGFDPATGTYEVQSFEPRFADQDGAATLTIVLALTEIAADVFEWDAAADEADFSAEATVSNAVTALAAPGALTVTSAARVVGDGSYAPQALLSFAPSASGAVVAYQAQRRVSGGVWIDIPAIDSDQIDGAGDIYAEVEGLSAGVDYDFRVYAVARDGRRSAPSVAAAVTIAAPVTGVAVPVDGEASSPVAGEAHVSYATPPDSDVAGIRIYASDADDSATAVQIAAAEAAPNQTLTAIETGLTPAATRYFWARSEDAWGGLSGFSDGVSVIIS